MQRIIHGEFIYRSSIYLVIRIYFRFRYVDVILNLIRIAGDYVSEEVWYRVIQIVINRDEVQGYAAKTVFEVNENIFFFSVTSVISNY